jgi:hypothetical protein
MTALLAERRPGWGDLLDLARGGLDARLHRLARPPAQLVAAMPRREIVMAVPARPTYGVVERQPIGPDHLTFVDAAPYDRKCQ